MPVYLNRAGSVEVFASVQFSADSAVGTERQIVDCARRATLLVSDMLFERQRLLLSLLDALGGPVGSTDFQKLLMLYTLEHEAKPSYEFVPYRYGGFSFTSYADKRRLTEQGLLEEGDNWALSQQGRELARQNRDMSTKTAWFAQHREGLRGDALIAELYRRHPYYAIRSEILNRVLSDDAEACARVDAARPTCQPRGLLTIGYEGKSLEFYLNLLLQASVTLLCDVRRNPLSRKYGFSKATLAKACEGVGIRYEHLPELGIASEQRRGLDTQADYDALFAIYRRNNLPRQGDALAQIARWIEQDGQRVALTCFEEQPCQCHRHCVADALQNLRGKLLVPTHL